VIGPAMVQDTTVPDAVIASPNDVGKTLAIRWVFPSGDGSVTRLKPGTTLLGRDPGCAGYLPSMSVSRKHAEIRWVVGTSPMLFDLESTNGLHVNGRPVKQAHLNPRDVIRLGDWIGILTSFSRDASEQWSFQELTKGYWGGPVLQASLGPAKLVAASDLPIVIQGETGSGKEGAARSIHAWSRREGPFLALNCAALPEALAEGELFGYRKGAFTGAERANPGFLRAAQGGTLFLDEIADLSLPIQAKLLRAVEQREVVPLGESTPVGIDVRLLAATQSPLRLAVAEKRFRGDLLARLAGLTVAIPPLRERVEEIPSLFGKIIEQHRGSAALPRLDPLLIERLCSHDWPFNVRELALLVRKLLALHPDAAVLDHTAFTEPLGAATGISEATPAAGQPALEDSGRHAPTQAPVSPAAAPTSPATTPQSGAPDLQTEIDALKKARILDALDRSAGNQTSAARMLGISRGTLISRLDAFGIARPRKRDDAPEE
jgi:two-component system, NtrC family, response regulator AtoC